MALVRLFLTCSKIRLFARRPKSFSLRAYACSVDESPPQFKNRIMARVYVRSITRCTMYQKAPSGVWRISSNLFSSIKKIILIIRKV